MIRCRLCDVTVTDVEAAIDDGWYPSFWVDDTEICTPVCPTCVRRKMIPGDGELELHPDWHSLFASPAADTPVVVGPRP